MEKRAADASVCVNEPGGLPTDSARAEGRLTGRRCPGRGRGRPRAPSGVARGCWTPRAVARAEVARVRGRCATPRSLAKRRERRGRTLHFSHFARGGLARGAVPRPRSLVDFDSGRTLLFPRLRRARSLWPGVLPSRRRVRSPYRDRPRETTRRPREFSPCTVRFAPRRSAEPGSGGPGVPPREALHATEREPSRERAFAVRGRPLRRPRFPGRRKVCRPKKKIPMRYSLRILKACDAQKMKRFARGERKPHWVFVARTAPPPRR